MAVPRSVEGFARPSGSSVCLSPASVLADDLAAEYPEVPGPALAQALDSAYVAAFALGGSTTDLSASRVAVLARDRLDVLRQRALAAQRRVGRVTGPGSP